MWQIIRELVTGGAYRLPHHPVPGGSSTGSPTASPSSTAAGSPPRAPPRSSSGSIPGGHVRLRFSDPAAYRSAVSALGQVTTDDEALALQIPNDGSQRELRSVLDRLERSRHRGRRADRAHPRPRRRVLRPDRRRRPSPTSPRSPSDERPPGPRPPDPALPRRARLTDDAAPQPAARAALPLPHPEPAAHPGDAAAALRLHLRRRDERGHRRRRTAPTTSPTSSRAS